MAAGAGTRPLLALIAWAMCAPALVPYSLLADQALSEIGRPGWSLPARALWLYGGIAAGCGAWAALARMTWGWVRERPLPGYWPLLCIALGALALAGFGGAAAIAAMFAWPAIAFAGFLAFWHLRANARARTAR